MDEQQNKKPNISDDERDTMRKIVLSWINKSTKSEPVKKNIESAAGVGRRQILPWSGKKKTMLPIAIKKSQTTDEIPVAPENTFLPEDKKITPNVEEQLNVPPVTDKPEVVTPAPAVSAVEMPVVEIVEPKVQIVETDKPKDVKLEKPEPQPAVSVAKRSFVVRRPQLVGVYKVVWVMFVAVTLMGVGSKFIFANDSVPSFFAKFTPVPYALVGNKIVWQSSFDRELAALEHFKNAEQLNDKNLDLNKQAQVAIVRRMIAEQIAAEEGVWVTQKEIDNELASVVDSAGSLMQVESTLANLWGWTIDEYQHYILRPMLLKKGIQSKYSTDLVLKNEVGDPGNITQIDGYLDRTQVNYKIVIF